MKQSKTQIKSKLIIGLIALVTITLAIFGLADFSVPFESKVLDNAKLPRGSVSKTTVTIADDGAIICDSLVQGIRDCDLADGNYIFRVTGNVDGTEEIIDYPVELINYYNDVTYSLEEGETEKIISLGDDTTDYKMLAVKYHKDLTINEGITLTATNVEDLTYKKGMYVCVLGELTNNGTISMTARGTYNCAGENVYLWKKTDGNFEYVPAVGGAGGGASEECSDCGGDYDANDKNVKDGHVSTNADGEEEASDDEEVITDIEDSGGNGWGWEFPWN